MQMRLKNKLFVDVVMAIVLLLSMAYLLVGMSAHEWIGTVFFILFMVHNISNWRWYKNLFRGKYTKIRILQTVVNLITLISMVALMISGIIFASYSPDFLRTADSIAMSRTLHMLGAYWGFIFMALHVGIHGQMIKSFLERKLNLFKSIIVKRLLYFIFLASACYGLVSLIKHDIFSYMFMLNEFVFFDTKQSLGMFLIDYLSMMMFCICCMYYFCKFLEWVSSRKKYEANALKNEICKDN